MSRPILFWVNHCSQFLIILPSFLWFSILFHYNNPEFSILIFCLYDFLLVPLVGTLISLWMRLLVPRCHPLLLARQSLTVLINCLCIWECLYVCKPTFYWSQLKLNLSIFIYNFAIIKTQLSLLPPRSHPDPEIHCCHVCINYYPLSKTHCFDLKRPNKFMNHIFCIPPQFWKPPKSNIIVSMIY